MTKADNSGDQARMERPPKPLESLPDVQQERADVDVIAGVSDFSIVFKGSRWTLPVKLTILVPTRHNRGVHMSRLISAAQKSMKGDYIEGALANICGEVNRTQPGCEIVAELSYPVRDQFLDVRILMDGSSEKTYLFEKIGMTACPCSKEIIGIGHMQRSRLRMELSSHEMIDFEEVALKMGECFSAEPVELLKRSAEAEKILAAQANPKFVEDIVRDCLERFPDASMIEAKAWESIHAHNAVAVWKRGDWAATA